MNKPCQIRFHEDSAPLFERLPERYRSHATELRGGREVLSLLVQNAFIIDYAPEILRTRVGGSKSENPVDFPLASISFIEWYYGTEVPEPLTPEPHVPKER